MNRTCRKHPGVNGLRRAALALATTATLVVASVAYAEYPDRPLQIIVPFDAGSGVDLIARGTLSALSKDLGQPVVVVNQPGASTALGAIAVKNAKPDGYTLGMLVISTLAVLPNTRTLQYNSSDYTYICQVYEAPTVVLVAKDSPFKTLRDLMDFARANPDKFLYGSPGPGTSNHIAMAALLKSQNAKGVHVPLASNAAVYQAMGRNEVVANIDSVLATRVNSNVRALAVLSRERSKLAPDLPSAKEIGIDFEVPVWGGLVAPKSLPAALQTRLSSACRKAVEGSDFAQATSTLATLPTFRPGPDYAKYVEGEQAHYRQLIKDAGLEPK